MAEHGAVATAESAPKPKRSLVKIALLGLNVLLFLAGVGSFAWSKFAAQPQSTEMTQTQEHQDEPRAEGAAGGPKGHSEAPAKKHDSHGGSAKGEHGGAAKGAHGSGGGKSGSGDALLVPLAPFIVNLSGDNGQRYLRLVAQVEVRGESAKAELEAQLPGVRNRLIFLLTSKTFHDIGSVQGKYDLQADITKNINETLDGPFIKKTYFTEFIVQ